LLSVEHVYIRPSVLEGDVEGAAGANAALSSPVYSNKKSVLQFRQAKLTADFANPISFAGMTLLINCHRILPEEH